MTPRHYNRETLEGIARYVLSQFDLSLSHSPSPIPIETIMERVYSLIIDFQYIRNNGRVLGETVFEDMMLPIYERENKEGYKLIPVKAGTVILDMGLLIRRRNRRYRFTCAHELAHWIIHKYFYTQLGETAAQTLIRRSSEADRTIEWQADRLVSYLLMPKGAVKTAFYRNQSGHNVVEALAATFEVSNQAMEIRLNELCLLS